MRDRYLVAVMMVLATVAGLGCGSKAGDGPSSASERTPTELMNTLASRGDADVFEDRYAAVLDDGNAVLFVGTRGDAAVGYYCDPGRGASWLTGTRDGASVSLSGPNGVALSGTVENGAVSGSLSAPSNSGPVTLLSAPAATLAREADVPAGSTVSGLVTYDDSVWGVVQSSPGGIPGAPTTTTTTNVPPPNSDIGLLISTNSGRLSGKVTADAAFVGELQASIERAANAIATNIAGVEKLAEAAARIKANVDEFQGSADKNAATKVRYFVYRLALASYGGKSSADPTWFAAALGRSLTLLTSSSSSTTTTTAPSALPPIPTVSIAAR